MEIEYKSIDGIKTVLSKADVLPLVGGKASAFITDKEIEKFMQICKKHQIDISHRQIYLRKDCIEKDAFVMMTIELAEKISMAHPKCQGWNNGIIALLDLGRYQENRIEKREGTLIYPNETLLGGWALSHPAGWHVPTRWQISLDHYKEKIFPIAKTPNDQAAILSQIALMQLLRNLYIQSPCYLWAEIGVDISYGSVEELITIVSSQTGVDPKMIWKLANEGNVEPIKYLNKARYNQNGFTAFLRKKGIIK